ncbi:hypothetical protein CRE_14428 [Caenorhabditis remanei]|uniref:Teneurin-like YD-shell domain-containing protein n=1 Tax=Caenorhabditis remanei TaxID=31234 RepID=E3NSX2_CAERE|nr:hypothetical protein CRE_14428 [Caenorhabditis remanei]
MRSAAAKRVVRAAGRGIAGLAAVTLGVTLAPPDALALEVASAQATTREVILDARRNAAAARTPGEAQKQEGDEKNREPLAEMQLAAGRSATLEADSIGVTAEFSGYQVPGKLDVTMAPAPAGAAESAAAEVDGKPIGKAVEITAVTNEEKVVTKFPAEVETVSDEHGVESAVDVTPGITLGFDVDPAQVKKAGADPSTLRIYTREAEGDPWQELPSYYDRTSKRVVGESDHLSQFVVIGKKFVPPPGPRIVLDPDDDYGWAETPSPASELPYNVALSNMAAAKLSQACLAPVVVTRQADVRFVSGSTRAAIAKSFNPVITVTVAFDAVSGSAWGTFHVFRFREEIIHNSCDFIFWRQWQNRYFFVEIPLELFRRWDISTLTLFVDYLDGRLSRIGAGWSFELGGRAQRFDDGSVLVVRGDGASYVFTSNGAGTYSSEAGLGLTLRNAAGGILELRSDAGELWRYDAGDEEGIGELISHTDRQGNTTRLSYGPANPDVHQFVPLTSITDAAGQTVRVENDGVGRITALVHPDGRRWKLSYDGSGNLAAITGPDGGVRAYSYDGSHRMLTATDALGVTYLKNAYDGSGRVVKQWDADGNLRTFSYGNGVTTYTDAEGKIATFTWDQGKRITRVQDAAGGDTRFSYDSAGRTTKTTDADGTTSYTYDSRGNVASETKPDGSVWKYTWTPNGELASETDPLGRTTTHAVDSRGLRTRTTQADGSVLNYSYTAAGDLATVTSPSGAVERFGYDARGNLTQRTSAAGRATKYGYDSANRMVTETDPMGGTTTYRYDAGDRIVGMTDPMGRTTSYTYDRNGQPLTETAPDGGVTKFSWDKQTRMATVTDPEGGVTKYAYNTEDALTSTTDPMGGITKYRVDPMGRATEVIDPIGGKWATELDAAGRSTSKSDPLGRKSRTGYDKLGRIVSETDAEGGEWKFTYDAVGNLTQTLDPEGGKTQYRFDKLDNLVEVVDPDKRATRYEYDADGHEIAEINPTGSATGYRVDADGVVLEMTNALGHTSTFEYDPAGMLVLQTDPLGNTTEFEYDAAGQLTVQRDPKGGETRYEYDAAGRIIATTDPEGSTRRAQYDKAGRVVATVDALGASTRFVYDQAGRQTQTIDPEGRTVSYRYDEAGQLEQVVEGDDTLSSTTGYTYSAAGELSQVTDPRGGRTLFEYDRAGRMTRRTDPGGVASYVSYDRNGRVTSESNGAGQTRKLTYTPGSLLSASSDPSGRTAFEYDGAGRMILMKDPEGVTAWKYDKLGRVLSETSNQNRTTKATYDAGDRVTSLTLPTGKQVEYRYDRLGQIVAQNTPWGDLSYSWRADGVLEDITRGDGVRTTITSDAEQRPLEITHAEPVPKTKKTPSAAGEVSRPKKTPAACPVDGAATYLEKRTLVNLEGEDEQCVKTADYLDRRTPPAPKDPVGDGGALRYQYSYGPSGFTKTAKREILGATPTADERGGADSGNAHPRPVIESQTQEFDYDVLGRLSKSTTAEVRPGEATRGKPAAETQMSTVFGYDANGNRTTATTTTSAGSAKLNQKFDAGNRLTSQTASGGENPGTRTYSYDGAGRRTSERGAGAPEADYSYAWGNTPTSVRTGERTTTTDYDGLGRATSQTTKTRFGSDKVSQAFFEGAQVDRVSSQHGTNETLWDATGAVAGIGTDTDDEARWALLDGLGSVVAEATGPTAGDISQLAGYSDYGVPSFDSSGYAQSRGYTGEVQDGATGITSFATRDYDPNGATWLAPDAWPGLLVAPATLNGYAYVLGNPTTFVDESGFRAVVPRIVNPFAWASKIAAAAAARAAAAAVRAAAMAARVVINTRNALAARYVAQRVVGQANAYVRAQRVVIGARSAISLSSAFTMVRHLTARRTCFSSFSMAVSCLSISHRTNLTTMGILGNWLLGNPNDAKYGPNSAFTQLIREHSSTAQYRDRIAGWLKMGVPPQKWKGGGYDAGGFSPSNKNLWRDIGTLVSWPAANDQSKMLVTLGTYNLNAKVLKMNPGSRTAKVRFSATNDTTLGSLMRTGIHGMYEKLNVWAGEHGPLSRYGQTFYWEETIRW